MKNAGPKSLSGFWDLYVLSVVVEACQNDQKVR